MLKTVYVIPDLGLDQEFSYMIVTALILIWVGASCICIWELYKTGQKK